MRRRLPTSVTAPLGTLLLTGVTLAAWAAWLGWDQHRDVHPDGSETGPYAAWQVVGLVLTLLVAAYAAVSLCNRTVCVLGITAGLTAAAFWDWSDDSSGLYALGATMVALGSLLATTAVAFVITAVRGGRGRVRG
ncbi:hypothetical protein AB0P12_20625 [Streptomyces subrutilus]|uniref:hypothetical protein n=1 Tax=Streptomyces subrutilus TaxID=36818 RepID=UPI0033D6EDF7